MTHTEQFLSDIGWQKWQTSHRLFAILDCAQLSDEDRRAVHQLDANVCHGLFKGTQDEGLHAVEPLLLDPVRISTSHGLPWLLRCDQSTPALLWLASNLPMNELARNMRSLLSVNIPGSQDALLRFYDPRVFRKLMTVLSADQKAMFFASAQQWWAWNMPSSKRDRFPAPSTPVQAAEKITLSSAQMQALDQMDMEDFVLKTKANMVRQKDTYLHTKTLSDGHIERLVEEHINKAVAFGLESEESVVEYLRHLAAVLGWSFEEEASRRDILSVLQNDSLDEDEKLARLKNLSSVA
jgi:hypothetical protein